jgi:UDP-N-acetylglucosamine:LPS N-acetylglucosamine transferase
MFKILIIEKPKVVISTGAEIAIPVFYMAKLLKIKTIFIESWCRVFEPSTTGKSIYPIADIFFVQWKQLLKKYGKKAKYEGAVI